MYGISPEDRLWLANHDQAERRQLAAADRMASSAGSAGRSGAGPSPLDAALTGTHQAWARVRHALLVHRPLAHHGAVR